LYYEKIYFFNLNKHVKDFNKSSNFELIFADTFCEFLGYHSKQRFFCKPKWNPRFCLAFGIIITFICVSLLFTFVDVLWQNLQLLQLFTILRKRVKGNHLPIDFHNFTAVIILQRMKTPSVFTLAFLNKVFTSFISFLHNLMEINFSYSK